MSLLTRWDSDARRAVDVEIGPWAKVAASLAAALVWFSVFSLLRGRRRR